MQRQGMYRMIMDDSMRKQEKLPWGQESSIKNEEEQRRSTQMPKTMSLVLHAVEVTDSKQGEE